MVADGRTKDDEVPGVATRSILQTMTVRVLMAH